MGFARGRRSFEIFAGGVAATRTGDYTARDRHYIVDHAGLSGDYSTYDTLLFAPLSLLP